MAHETNFKDFASKDMFGKHSQEAIRVDSYEILDSVPTGGNLFCAELILLSFVWCKFRLKRKFDIEKSLSNSVNRSK